VGFYGITDLTDPLYVNDIIVVPQYVDPTLNAFTKAGIADHVDHYMDMDPMIPPAHSTRIWLHTHPDFSSDPSFIDEEMFDEMKDNYDWSVMFILSTKGDYYCRMAHKMLDTVHEWLLPMAVDWENFSAIPEGMIEMWEDEHDINTEEPHPRQNPAHFAASRFGQGVSYKDDPANPTTQGVVIGSGDGNYDPWDEINDF
jgi:hypothetical protein